MRLSTITGGKRRVVTLTGSGNFTVPPGVYALEAYLQGAGGSGAAGHSIGSHGVTGGGCGAAINGSVIDVNPGDVIPYACGAGGAAVSYDASAADGVIDGNDGGDTTFSSLTALGGYGGKGGAKGLNAGYIPVYADGIRYSGYSNNFANGSLAYASGGVGSTLNSPRGVPGGFGTSYSMPPAYVQGESGATGNTAYSSGGMGTRYGKGGDAAYTTSTGSITADDGEGYGAGGGGAMSNGGAFTGTITSGAGADGVIEVVYYGPEYA